MSRRPLALALLFASTVSLAPAAAPPQSENYGVVRGDIEAADGLIVIKDSSAPRRTFSASAAPVLMEITPDETLAISFSMDEVAHPGDPPTGLAEFVCQIEVALADLQPADRIVPAPIRLSLSDRSNVFAVWLTVGFFEVNESEPAHRFFAVIDRSGR
jgi:hypothetical protein